MPRSGGNTGSCSPRRCWRGRGGRGRAGSRGGGGGAGREGARERLEEGEDRELRKVVEEAPARLAELEEEIRLAMVERDPNDDKNVLVEIRAGTGGDEAALFAGDLYKMLTRYAEARGFATEVLSQSHSDAGGFKEVTLGVKG